MGASLFDILPADVLARIVRISTRAPVTDIGARWWVCLAKHAHTHGLCHWHRPAPRLADALAQVRRLSACGGELGDAAARAMAHVVFACHDDTAVDAAGDTVECVRVRVASHDDFVHWRAHLADTRHMSRKVTLLCAPPKAYAVAARAHHALPHVVVCTQDTVVDAAKWCSELHNTQCTYRQTLTLSLSLSLPQPQTPSRHAVVGNTDVPTHQTSLLEVLQDVIPRFHSLDLRITSSTSTSVIATDVISGVSSFCAAANNHIGGTGTSPASL